MLGLKKVKEIKDRYANNIMMEPKPIYGVATIELKGCSTNLDVFSRSASGVIRPYSLNLRRESSCLTRFS